jgi:ATP-dependent RNA helicase RhlE
LTFSDFNFSSSLLEALSMMGFETPTPIQTQAIPVIMENHDLIACAQTGTGKTGAFLLPILNKSASEDSKSNHIRTLIIAPTRELALQIDQQIEGFGYFLGVSSLPVYGGGDSSSWDQQKKALSDGADIIVATPGRLIAHINLGYVDFSHLEHLILDEADRMLDMGFHDDIMKIVNKLPKKRQTLLFSATMPSKIRQLSKKLLNNPKQLNIAMSKPAEGVLQGAYLVFEEQKINLIEYLLTGKKNYPSILIFASTKKKVREINQRLRRKNFACAEISSDLDQEQRESALREFKSRNTQILVATDILARGIDIKEISLVINYEVPQDAEDYVHRIGRTARADATGVALTLISDKDQYRFKQIEELIGSEVMKMPNPPEIGEGPKYEPNRKQRRGNFRGNKRNSGRKPFRRNQR